MRRVSPMHRAAIERIHDRRSQDLPINAIVAPMIVRDPAGDLTQVDRSLRDDPIGAMHARGQIGEAPFAAARHWQRCYEAVEIAGARAIDISKEAVDGGRLPEMLTDEYSRAMKDLRRAAAAMGMEGEAIVRDVLGRYMPLLHAAAARGLVSKDELMYFGKRFRECLDTLAVVFGYAMRPRD